MIINLRGPAGSGKTTVVRRIMGLMTLHATYRTPGRKSPLGYLYLPDNSNDLLYIPGGYENACGGCDTLCPFSYRVLDSNSTHHNVLFEGMTISQDVQPILTIAQSYPVVVVYLTTTLADCEAGIEQRRAVKLDAARAKIAEENARRSAAGRALLPEPQARPDFNRKRSEAKWRGTRNAFNKLLQCKESGKHPNLDLWSGGREEAFHFIRRLLHV